MMPFISLEFCWPASMDQDNGVWCYNPLERAFRQDSFLCTILKTIYLSSLIRVGVKSDVHGFLKETYGKKYFI